MATSSYGSITVIDTNDIESVYMVYRGSDSNTETPLYNTWAEFNNWVQDASQTSGQYIWQITVIPRSGIPLDENNYTDYIGQPVCITSGRSIVATTTQFTATGDTIYALLVDEPSDWETNWTDYYYYDDTDNTYKHLTDAEAPVFVSETYYELVDTTQESVMRLPDDAWSGAPPEYNSDAPIYWVRVINTFDQEPKMEYVYYRDNSLTDAMTLAYQAYDNTQILNDAIDDINGSLTNISGSLENFISTYNNWTQENGAYISALNEEMAKYTGSIIIDDTVPSITLTSSSQGGDEVYSMEITSAQLNLKYKTQITAYISGQTFRAPEGSFSDIVMNNGDTGDLRWIARSNGHLSLKVVK